MILSVAKRKKKILKAVRRLLVDRLPLAVVRPEHEIKAMLCPRATTRWSAFF